MSLLEGQEADGGITIELESTSNGANVKDNVLSAASLYWGAITYTTGITASSSAMAFGDSVSMDNSSTSMAFGDQ
jgi:hypothetical protein